MPESRILLVIKVIQLSLGMIGLSMMVIGGIQLLQIAAFRLPIILVGSGALIFSLSLLCDLLIFDKRKWMRVLYFVLLLTISSLCIVTLNSPSFIIAKLYVISTLVCFVLWTNFLIERKNNNVILRGLNLLPFILFSIAILLNMANGWFWMFTAITIPVYLAIGIYVPTGNSVSIDESSKTM